MRVSCITRLPACWFLCISPDGHVQSMPPSLGCPAGRNPGPIVWVARNGVPIHTVNPSALGDYPPVPPAPSPSPLLGYPPVHRKPQPALPSPSTPQPARPNPRPFSHLDRVREVLQRRCPTAQPAPPSTLAPIFQPNPQSGLPSTPHSQPTPAPALNLAPCRPNVSVRPFAALRLSPPLLAP